jgi:hypothetical protein
MHGTENLKLKMEQSVPKCRQKQTECSETSAYKIQTLGNYPEESIQQSNGYYNGL